MHQAKYRLARSCNTGLQYRVRECMDIITCDTQIRCDLSWWSKSKSHSRTAEATEDVVDAPIISTRTRPIVFNNAAIIEGMESQVLTVKLEKGQKLRAEAGNMIYMTEDIKMDTNTGGGVLKAFSRVITGQNFMITDFSVTGEKPGYVCLGSSLPAKIIRITLKDFNGVVICQRGAFLAGSETVDVSTELTNPMAGLFGSEGFVLQRLSGEGDAFLNGYGHVIKRSLKAGELLRASAGSIVCFSSTVTYNVDTAKGLRNIAFGTGGLFMATLTGPGLVYLQGLPFDRLARAIGSAYSKSNGGLAGSLPPFMTPGSTEEAPKDGESNAGNSNAQPNEISRNSDDLYGDVTPDLDEIIDIDDDIDD